jgi:hypothetical protein
MTTQETQVTVGNARMSKIFNLTATDNQWDGNVLTDSISSQSIGILIPNTPINYAAAEYEAGGMAFRLQNAQTLLVKARGFANQSGLDCFASQQITPVTVGQNDILVVYPVPIAGVGESNTLAWIQTSKSTELFTAMDATDNASKAMTSAVNSLSLGDLFFGSTLQRIWVQVQDGAALNYVDIVDEMGGVVMTLQGGKRGAMVGSKSNQYNLYAMNLGVPIGKGWSIRVNSSTV